MDHQEKSWLEENAAAVGGGILVVLVVIIILLLIVIYRSIFLKKVCVINLLYYYNILFKTLKNMQLSILYFIFKKEKRKNGRSGGVLPYAAGYGDVRRKSFAGPGMIFSPDLPPIDEEEATDSSIETEDDDIEDCCGNESIVDQDIEVQ